MCPCFMDAFKLKQSDKLQWMFKEASFQKQPRSKKIVIPVITWKTPSKQFDSTMVEK